MIDRVTGRMTRRSVLRGGALLAGGAFVARGWPAAAFWAQAAQDGLAARRAQMGAAPIERAALGNAMSLLSGPGGNVVVLDGRDGKLVVDGFVQPAYDKLRQALAAIGSAPVKTLIDTHWHFDHADNNANFRKAGAAVLAHENTSKRLQQPHDLLGMRLEPSPPEMLPTQTFADRHTLETNGERVEVGHVPPAHTDTDVYVHFTNANVLHLGDLYFAGMYPFFDAGTGGRIDGMIGAADLALKRADARTKIVPGHGPLSDRAALTRYRDMMALVRDRVQKLKASGRPLADVVAAAPTADLDAEWGKGFMQAKDFVALVYTTL